LSCACAESEARMHSPNTSDIFRSIKLCPPGSMIRDPTSGGVFHGLFLVPRNSLRELKAPLWAGDQSDLSSQPLVKRHYTRGICMRSNHFGACCLIACQRREAGGQLLVSRLPGMWITSNGSSLDRCGAGLLLPFRSVHADDNEPQGQPDFCNSRWQHYVGKEMSSNRRWNNVCENINHITRPPQWPAGGPEYAGRRST